MIEAISVIVEIWTSWMGGIHNAAYADILITDGLSMISYISIYINMLVWFN